ncbi:MAG: hypothetical protein ACJ74Q_15260 [Pyrinomonadaceae bacterium]
MAANIIYPTAEQWALLGDILDELGEGGIIVPPDTAAHMLSRGVPGERVTETTYLNDYDFGGDADIFLDVARPDNYAYEQLLSAISPGNASSDSGV